ncbi:alpha/beta hydrolase [bacterium]|nr:alpha/beta hydrolase [bacterium]
MRSFMPLILLGCILWAAAAPAAETPSRDGVSIAYDVHGEGEPTLVFVHGWCCDRGYWQAQVAEFSQTHGVVTIDLAGHGASGTEREEWTVTAYAADVAAVVDALALEDCVLIGHSMSGSVIVEAVRLLPGRVRGLIGVDTLQDLTFAYTAEQSAGYVADMSTDFPGKMDAFVRNMFPEDADPALVDRVVADMSAAPPGIALATLSHYLSHDLKPALGELDVPLRCLNADLWPLNLEGNHTIYADFAVVSMEGVGHFLFQEAPDAFNGKLAEILREFER